jgi:polysaccharide biosynthesis protein PslG
MHRSVLISVLGGAALVALLAAASATARPGSPQARVKRALVERGYDSAKVSCETPPLPVACQTNGLYRDPNGALERCTREATAARRAVRLRAPRCSTVAPAPAWPALGFNGMPSFSDRDIASMQAVGATSSRLFVQWAWVEPLPGVYDFSNYMDLYRSLVEAGTPPLLTVTGAPSWAQPAHPPCSPGAGCAYPPAPAFDSAWQRFIKELISRMPAAVGVEIWNEPNWDLAWSPKADPERYADLVSLADGAAAETPQDPPVLFAGLYPVGGGPTSIEPAEFLRRAYERGVSYDVLGVHAYPSRSRSGSYVPAMMRTIEPLWRVAAAHGDHPDSWLTELGISTGGSDAMRASDREQARAVVDVYRAARRTRRIDAVYIHKLRDAPDIDDSSWGYHLGLRYADDTPKPAYCELAGIRHLPCR